MGRSGEIFVRYSQVTREVTSGAGSFRATEYHAHRNSIHTLKLAIISSDMLTALPRVAITAEQKAGFSGTSSSIKSRGADRSPSSAAPSDRSCRRRVLCCPNFGSR